MLIPRPQNSESDPMEKMSSRYSTCIGPSMYPTLKPGDGIDMNPYQDPLDMKVGDVITYPYPSGTVTVVHRIIAIKAGRVITRGDNNNKIDPYTIGFEDIIGKVISAKRGNRLIPIRGGKKGFYFHKLMLFRKYMLQYVLPPLRFLSNQVAASGIFTGFHSVLDLRIVRIKRENDCQLILVSGRHVIGKKDSDFREWQIRFPYKYFVNKHRLEKDEN